jgi:hypothetical protein
METAGIRGDAASMKADAILKDIESRGTVGSQASIARALLAIEARLEVISWRLEEIGDLLAKD